MAVTIRANGNRARLNWVAIALLCLTMPPAAQAQDLGSGSASGAGDYSGGSPGNGGAALGGGPMGGAAMADFGTLMNLIQQTIDPDSWLQAGGTSNILPYPAGVYVDPVGHMRRVRAAEELQPELLSAVSGPQHPWRTQSPLRTVSLRGLETELRKSLQQGMRPTLELSNLAGLERIQYVKIDAANEDVLLAGPASGGVVGFELEDLAVVAALIRSNTQPMGCSIEPSDAGIVAAQALLQQPTAMKRLARNPKQFVDSMQSAIGPHKVIVFGMRPNTGTAMALIDADEHMKQVGFGTVATRTRIDSYFTHLDRQAAAPAQSMIRWWFDYSDEAVKSNKSGEFFELPAMCVRVMSEQQWMTRDGRAATGQNDLAADQFADGISGHLPELRRTHASYARLVAVFEMALAMQLSLEATGQPSLEAWFPTLCELGTGGQSVDDQRAVDSGALAVPRSVAGLTTSHRLKNGTVVAVVSGGVKIDAPKLAASENWRESQYLAKSLVPEASVTPTTAHGRWWWDQP